MRTKPFIKNSSHNEDKYHTCVDVNVECIIAMKLAAVKDDDRYDPNVEKYGEPVRRERKYGVAVIRAVSRTSVTYLCRSTIEDGTIPRQQYSSTEHKVYPSYTRVQLILRARNDRIAVTVPGFVRI